MRWFLLLVAALLGACNYLPSVKKIKPQQQEPPGIVEAAIDQYQSSGETELLQQLAERMPGSAWGRYADALLKLTAELELQEAQPFEKEVDCSRFAAENKALDQENKQLNQKIEQLKKLLIELERRSQ